MATDDQKPTQGPVPGSPQGQALKNPYGGKPGGGITLPEYFRPTKYITGSRANYFPLSEEIGGNADLVVFPTRASPHSIRFRLALTTCAKCS